MICDRSARPRPHLQLTSYSHTLRSMRSAGVRGMCMRSAGQGRAAAAPFVRLPGRQRKVQKTADDRDTHAAALPLQELASAATTLGFLGDTPTEVFASTGLLLTAAGILIIEAIQSSSTTTAARSFQDSGVFPALCRLCRSRVVIGRSQADTDYRKCRNHGHNCPIYYCHIACEVTAGMQWQDPACSTYTSASCIQTASTIFVHECCDRNRQRLTSSRMDCGVAITSG